MTAVDDGPVSPAVRLWEARRTIDQHTEAPSEFRATGRCAQCADDGSCVRWDWALTVVAGPGRGVSAVA